LYVAESSPTTTGAKADHKIVARQIEIDKIARALAAKLGVAGATAEHLDAAHEKWVEAAAKDLAAHKGKSVVVPGVFQSAAVNALAHAMNSVLGNIGQTVSFIDPVEIDPVDNVQSIRELADDMNAGKVETLIVMGVNPIYNAPADLEMEKAFAAMAQKNKIVVQISSYKDDTTDFATWHVPGTHYLEAWSDARAYDGTATIIQPMIAPLYDGKSVHEILAIFTDQPGTSGYDLVRSYWRSQHPGDDFEGWWRRSVHDGYISGSAFPARAVSAKLGALPAVVDAGGVECIFRPDPTIFDGSFANNGWLQETPKPLSRTTWDNVVLISPAMASRMDILGMETESINDSDVKKNVNKDHQSDALNTIEITVNGRKVKAPAWTQPGHPDNSITLFFGYGHKKSGRVGMDSSRSDDKPAPRGYDAYSVRTAVTAYGAGGGAVVDTGDHWDVAVTQGHFSMDNREPVKAATLEEFIKNSNFAHAEAPPAKDETLYPHYEDIDWYKKYSWGMAIDLNSCIGCQACSVACYAENNISVVGKEQVQRGREMMWIRIDSYYEGDPANPSVYFQPVNCMQCENAPCEPVCPVGATVHSTEGLNDMVYNRCVGTRYCSNNCPYKVRRFNFLLFADFDSPSRKLGRNPDVSVRSRGVMEKCTYCVQRINAARINAEKQDRKIRDGEIKTACEQACPTQAIVFGNIADPNSRVARLKAQERNYALLAELNTRPRTTYIAAVSNPNPELEKA